MEPDSSEASAPQIAREQGNAYGRALEHIAGEVAHYEGEQEPGHFRIGYAVEEAESMHGVHRLPGGTGARRRGRERTRAPGTGSARRTLTTRTASG